jgi:haloacetate dehalogenase
VSYSLTKKLPSASSALPTVTKCNILIRYVTAYSQPGALRGCFNDYRAAPEDTAQDLEDAHKLITCPILTMWGADFEPVGKMFDVEAVWKTMGNLVRAVPLPQCGHLPQEEQPEMVNAELLQFLKDWSG